MRHPPAAAQQRHTTPAAAAAARSPCFIMSERNLMSTLEEGRSSTCFLPRFSALYIVFCGVATCCDGRERGGQGNAPAAVHACNDKQRGSGSAAAAAAAVGPHQGISEDRHASHGDSAVPCTASGGAGGGMKAGLGAGGRDMRRQARRNTGCSPWLEAAAVCRPPQLIGDAAAQAIGGRSEGRPGGGRWRRPASPNCGLQTPSPGPIATEGKRLQRALRPRLAEPQQPQSQHAARLGSAPLLPHAGHRLQPWEPWPGPGEAAAAAMPRPRCRRPHAVAGLQPLPAVECYVLAAPQGGTRSNQAATPASSLPAAPRRPAASPYAATGAKLQAEEAEAGWEPRLGGLLGASMARPIAPPARAWASLPPASDHGDLPGLQGDWRAALRRACLCRRRRLPPRVEALQKARDGKAGQAERQR